MKQIFLVRATRGGRPHAHQIAHHIPSSMRFADFDRINHADEMRVSVGVVNVESGNFRYFDNRRDHLRREHWRPLDRPGEIRIMLEYMLNDWPAHRQLDPMRVGRFDTVNAAV